MHRNKLIRLDYNTQPMLNTVQQHIELQGLFQIIYQSLFIFCYVSSIHIDIHYK